MGIEINGKKYKFNLDIRLGILELMEKTHLLNTKQFKIIAKELLIPKPTPKELFNIKTSDMKKIFSGFNKAMRGESAEIKKKLSSS